MSESDDEVIVAPGGDVGEDFVSGLFVPMMAGCDDELVMTVGGDGIVCLCAEPSVEYFWTTSSPWFKNYSPRKCRVVITSRPGRMGISLL